MTYLTKRQIQLRPVLDKKAEIESAVVEVKQKQEFEQAKLDKIKTDLESVGLELSEINEILSEITNNSEALGGAVLDYIHKSLSAIKESETVLDKHESAINELRLLVEAEIQKFEDLKKYQEQIRLQMSEDDARLEIKRTDIKIYEDRLRKRLKDAGMEDQIKLIFT